MSTSKSHYHHGDLRESLLATALEMMEVEGIAAVSMRKLAERVGVSRSAPYHHFRDKQELLSAIAEAGFYEQDALLSQLADLEGRARLMGLIRHYIMFAAQHREQYNLMYGQELWRLGNATPSLEVVARQSFKNWLAEVERLQASQTLPDNLPSVQVAQVGWATLHGLCRLVNDGIYMNYEDIEPMEQALADMLGA